ncbi:DUF6059 family protein [Actinokineospora enzanensis]|uniref:DUF6059 family protein n=1 Tax=Actinokineospora enzanensis TaxID=155975 RepID=UPI00036AE9B9|nr:DUF6059 family protein [Actinokineospora enzanensis]
MKREADAHSSDDLPGGLRGLLTRLVIDLGAALYPHPDFLRPPSPPGTQRRRTQQTGTPPCHGHPERVGVPLTRAERAFFGQVDRRTG